MPLVTDIQLQKYFRIIIEGPNRTNLYRHIVHAAVDPNSQKSFYYIDAKCDLIKLHKLIHVFDLFSDKSYFGRILEFRTIWIPLPAIMVHIYNNIYHIHSYIGNIPYIEDCRIHFDKETHQQKDRYVNGSCFDNFEECAQHCNELNFTLRCDRSIHYNNAIGDYYIEPFNKLLDIYFKKRQRKDYP